MITEKASQEDLSSLQKSRRATDEITFKDLLLKIREIWIYLSSKKIVIISFVLIGAITGYFYAKSKITTYTANTTFVLEGANGAGGGSL